jgi:hypothetical protein
MIIFQTDEDPEGYLDHILKTFRGEAEDTESDGKGGYFLCGGSIAVNAGSLEEISENDFTVLKRNDISEL